MAHDNQSNVHRSGSMMMSVANTKSDISCTVPCQRCFMFFTFFMFIFVKEFATRSFLQPQLLNFFVGFLAGRF